MFMLERLSRLTGLGAGGAVVRAARTRARRLALAALPAVLLGPVSRAEPPTLYRQPTYQSPVHIEPDGLVFLPGMNLAADDSVVYEADDGSAPASAPEVLPVESTASRGRATVVGAAGVPYALTARLPAAIVPGATYRLRVVNAAGEWSEAVRVNDARPLWFTPSQVPTAGTIAHLPRALKIIGRNLAPNGDARQGPRVRLTGRRTIELTAQADASGETAIAPFVLRARLPNRLPAGQYRVEVAAGGGRWLPIAGQALTVVERPTPLPRFRIDDPAFGGCRANDERDDTPCVVRALKAAAVAGGGTVEFGPGRWHVRAGMAAVPEHVNIHGAGASVTEVVRHPNPGAPPLIGEFVLMGGNTVDGITFSDIGGDDATNTPRIVLQLGARYNTDEDPHARTSVVTDITITRNTFSRTRGAIVSGGAPLGRLYVTFNEIGDFRLGLDLGGNPFNVRERFALSDSVVAHNTFIPGSYLNLADRQGAMASELGASQRVDFSDNTADGSSVRHLDNPGDAAGFRAAFFWHMGDNHEMLLISRNTILCSGDKDGDGEAISFDNNINTFALDAAHPVLSSTRSTLSLAGPLRDRQNGRQVDTARYYLGQWIRIDSGPGIGQSRKITSYTIRDDSGTVEINVEPAWDVLPVAGTSTATISRTFWQALIVGNTVDHRAPLCRKSNRTRPKGGNISVWAQATDTVVANNRQYDTDGILFQQAYGAAEEGCPLCQALTSMPAFLDITGNVIDGEYDWTSSCSLSGIMGSFAASPNKKSSPPLLSFGISISHNTISRADGLYGGAINLVPTWYVGPPATRTVLLRGIAIDHNDIANITAETPRTECDYRQDSRVGIALHGERAVDGTVLYANDCRNVSRHLIDTGIHTQRVCDQRTEFSCECAALPTN